MTSRLHQILDFLFKWGSVIIFGLLIFVEMLILVNNWNAVFFGHVRAFWVLLPVIAFLTAENAVKLWWLKTFTRRIPCYVLDILCLIVLTIFSDGTLISTLYIIILSEFYLGQTSLMGSVAMGIASIVLFLVAFAVSGALKEQNVNIAMLISNGFNDILLMTLHFLGFNFVLHIYRTNNELNAALEEIEQSNEKLRAANAELSENRQKLQEAYKNLQEVTALEERQRIAKDIHDTAGHSITTIIMQTEAARLVIDSDPADAKRKIAAANLQARNALEELRDSIKMHGVIQPIVLAKNVDGGYIIIAGERRYRASQMAKLKTIPAIIKDYTDRQIKEIALIENLQREDLNPIETAKALREVMVEYDMTQDELADRIGKSRSAIANTLRLLSLTPEVIKLVEDGKLSAGHARTLVVLTDKKAQYALALRASDGKMSVRDLEKAVKDVLNPPVKKRKLDREQSLELKELVSDMQKVFSTKVSVLGSDNKGRIYIDYFSKDDLNRICELIEFLRSRN